MGRKPSETKRLSATETLELLNNQWATTSDVKKLACVGNNRGSDIMRAIRENAESQGYHLPRGLVPMEMVIDYLKININYLKKISKIEK